MKGLSYRNWILVLGVAVAMVIVMAAFLYNSRILYSVSTNSRPQTQAEYKTSLILKKTVERILPVKNQ